MLKEKVVTSTRVSEVVSTLAAELSADLEGRDPVFICILKGAIFFFTALTQRLSRSVVIDFIQVSSYGATTESSGTVILVKDITVDIAGKDVYLVEDIVDTGLTLADVVALLKARHPRSVQVVALLSKPSRRKVDVPLDFVGLEIEDRFVVGFGLDFAEQFRNLPDIWEYAPDQEGA
ncbi:MAG TPA: hypoxanthine phosphoribosyltransferase [Thermoanaerobaculaceae bacterium]|nr:hypoxanthine phosphoribosyltransferase [Thermoanaerobaculaceae bacterium]HRS15722.1 hypoxanthine phosphoribosyltransferase [Thermoanaerobaculaceae bacterium]